MNPPSFKLMIAMAVTIALLGTATLQAQVSNFTTTPGSDYATAANWSGGVIPGAGNNQQPWIGNNNSASAIYSNLPGYSTSSRFVIGIGNAGIGSLTLNGSAGTLAFGGDSLGTANYVGVDGGTGTLTISAGSVSLTNGASNGGHLLVGANGGGILSTGTVVVNTGGTLDAGTRILLGVNRTGNSGILTLSSNASTFTGNVAVNGGTLSLATGFNNPNPVNSAIGNATVARTVTIESGAILEFAANDVMGNAAALPKVTLVINEGGTVRNNGTKFSTLGALQLNGGILSANNGVNASFQAWSLTDTVTVGGTAASTISTTGTNSGIHLGSSANNIITFNVADVTGSPATDLLVAAPLINRNTGQGGGAGGLIKTGAGTMNLTAANTYTGGTLVSGGTLLVNNTLGSATGSGPVIVSAGATLGGSGIITGATTISGTHSPGNSPGIITHGDLTYTTGANVIWDLVGNTNLGRGVNFDGINVNGNLNFADPTALDLVFNLAESTVDWSNAFWSNNFFGTDGWLLYQVAGTTSNFGNLSINSINWADGNGGLFNDAPWGKYFGLHLDGNNIYLTYTPEPTKSVLLALGLLGLIARRRRP